MRILGVILAGGRGERLGGRNKALVEIGGRPLISWVIERARPQVNALAINANEDREILRQYGLPVFADTIVPMIADAKSREGPLAGILAALAFASSPGGADAVATFSVDSPLVPTDLVERLHQSLLLANADYAIAATPDGEHPVFGLWRVSRHATIHGLFRNGMRAPRQLERYLARAVAFFDDPGAFDNVNRPDDMAKLEHRICASRYLP